jgi:hypothetical protein
VTTPPEPAPAAPADQRIDKIEHEQERQGGILDKIVGMLGGDDKNDPTHVTQADDPKAAAADMGEQMRQAVRDVRAEEAAAAGTQEPKKPEPETTPREVMIRGKDRLQRALFGQDPKKP